MHRLFRLSGALLLAASLWLAGCASQVTKGEPSSRRDKDASSRKMAPDFALKDMNGKTVRLSDYRGQVVLLNFWATWCGPCKIEIPWFVEFQRTYKDRGFTVLGVSVDEDGWEAVRPFLASRQVNYPVVVSTLEVEQQYGGVEALPVSFLIDREGRIAATHVGLVTKKTYEDEIRRLLD
jgi:cytochrome c biogenesis protein CcmG/thiol:disulfide interchange protein DsbE